jgi:hypothetical protein
MQIELGDLFKSSVNYLELLSQYCIKDLHRQQPSRWSEPVERAEQLKKSPDGWVLAGAAPRYQNFQRFSLRKYGIVIHFDPYHVGSYAEGNYEVFIPLYELSDALQDEAAAILTKS